MATKRSVGAVGHTGRVSGMRGEERWVGDCIEAAMPGVRVIQHDDGSRPSMYDLDLVRDGVPFAAMEVTAAADAESIELWNLVNGSEDRWIESDIDGGWMVTVTPKARAKGLKKDLPDLLRALETRGEDREHRAAIDRLRGLGVLSASQSGTNFRGSIYVTLERDPERTGGAVPATGDGLVRWLDGWVREPAQQHNLSKLRAAERLERHLFVLLPGFTTAPFDASDVLMRADGPLPEMAPALPEAIADVWLMSTWSTGDIFHFGANGWSRSLKVFEIAGD
jgi:hypothetical protein